MFFISLNGKMAKKQQNSPNRMFDAYLQAVSMCVI